MTETERNQIKGALLKCAEENENKFTLTGHIVVSSLCKSAVERIAELEKENAELKEKLGDKVMQKQKDKADLVWKLKTANEQKASQLYKAKEIIKDYMIIVKGDHTEVCGVPEENRTINVLQLNEKAEEFLNGEVEKIN